MEIFTALQLRRKLTQKYQYNSVQNTKISTHTVCPERYMKIKTFLCVGEKNL